MPRIRVIVLAAIVATVAIAALAGAALAGGDCTVTSTGNVALSDLGAGLYLGRYPGGLYPDGRNVAPSDHLNAGAARAQLIRPLDLAGQPSPTGKYVLLSVGMSGPSAEFCRPGWGTTECTPESFMGQAAADPQVDHTSLVIVNGAKNQESAGDWDNVIDVNYERVRDELLTPLGVGELQVQAAWIKLVIERSPRVLLPAPSADAYVMVRALGRVVRAMKMRYPNLQLAFVSSRIYAGYSIEATLVREPYSYETAFAVKWLTGAQIRQMRTGTVDALGGDLDYNTVAPWLAWGPYLWADGLDARSDGLTWECADFEDDGTHPTASGVQKVGARLLQFFKTHSLTRPWFTVPAGQ